MSTTSRNTATSNSMALSIQLHGILVTLLVISLASMVSASHDEQRDFVAVLTGADTRLEQAKPYYIEFENGFVRRFRAQEEYVLNEPGFFYSYSYPEVYPYVPQDSRSRAPFVTSIEIADRSDIFDSSDGDSSRGSNYVYSPGYFEKGYSQVSRSLALSNLPREDRAYSVPKHRIYDNGPRLDIE